MKGAVLALLASIIASPCWAFDPYEFPGKGSMDDFKTAWGFYLSAKEAAEAGKLQEALPLYDKAIAKYPYAAIFYYDAAGKNADAKNYPKAEAYYGKAFQDAPDFGDALSGLANLQMKQNRFKEAISNFSKALAIAPTDKGARLGLVQALISTNNIPSAKVELKKVETSEGAQYCKQDIDKLNKQISEKEKSQR